MPTCARRAFPCRPPPRRARAPRLEGALTIALVRARALLAVLLAMACASAARGQASPGDAGDPDGMGLMPGALGRYPMTREASGTSWQPDTSVHAGLHLMSGAWSFMAHALLNGVYDWQGGAA